MKTLLFTLEFPPFQGGIANYYGNLANYWPINEQIIIQDNNQGELLAPRKFLTWWPALAVLNRKTKKAVINFVLVGQILPLGTVTWLLSWFSSWQYGVFLHGMDFSFALKSRRKRILAGLILGRAKKIICANTYVAKKVAELFPHSISKTVIINPGIPASIPEVDARELAELQTRYHLAGKTILFSLGRLVKRKGVDRTIKALANLAPTVMDKLIYFIAGTGPQEEYLKNLVPHRLTEKMFFLGSLSEREKWLWLKACDIFVMPSREIAGDFEGFGIVYLEANLSGKPVIAGAAGGVSDAVEDGQTGILVDPEDVNSIQQGIMKLVNNPELRNFLGQQGQSRVLKEFNWEQQIIKLVKSLNNDSKI